MTQTMIPSYGRNMNAGELDTNKCVIVQHRFQNVCIYMLQNWSRMLNSRSWN